MDRLERRQCKLCKGDFLVLSNQSTRVLCVGCEANRIRELAKQLTEKHIGPEGKDRSQGILSSDDVVK